MNHLNGLDQAAHDQEIIDWCPPDPTQIANTDYLRTKSQFVECSQLPFTPNPSLVRIQHPSIPDVTQHTYMYVRPPTHTHKQLKLELIPVRA